MRIHLGHHFYGAGNLGDDFMLAGFLGAMRSLAPHCTYTSYVPFALDPLRRRFPEVEWLGYTEAAREQCIRESSAWLGLGGSPFQCAQSRWFLDHLVQDADICARYKKPMFFLGIGVQTVAELASSEVRRLCAQAAAIWTRDTRSAERLAEIAPTTPVNASSDLAHLFFRELRPPSAQVGRVAIVANFDFDGWPGQSAVLDGIATITADEHVWLAQESRDLPGAERALYAQLPEPAKRRWKLTVADIPGAPLVEALRRWPSAEWLVSARYHATLAGCWAGSKILVLPTNEKLRGAAEELGLRSIAIGASAETVADALETATPAACPLLLAEQVFAACQAFTRATRAFA